MVSISALAAGAPQGKSEQSAAARLAAAPTPGTTSTGVHVDLSPMARLLSTLPGNGSLNSLQKPRNNNDIEDSDLPRTVKDALKRIRELKERLQELQKKLQALQSDARLSPDQKRLQLQMLQAQIQSVSSALLSASSALRKAMKAQSLTRDQQTTVVSLLLR